MPANPHKKNFLKLPRFKGGSSSYKEFITSNLKYPKEALEAGIEGNVVVEYRVNDNGDVISARVLKGLGYGCDEEALRLVRMLTFEKVKNRGVRVQMTTKTKIYFTLPRVNINYSVTEKKEPPKNEGSVTYEYTIDL
jgi:TonB family protein